MLYDEFREFIESINWSEPVDRHDYACLVYLIKLTPGLPLHDLESLGNLAVSCCVEKLDVTEEIVILENIQNPENDPIFRISVDYGDEDTANSDKFMYPFDIVNYRAIKKMLENLRDTMAISVAKPKIIEVIHADSE